jgi:hypothetical protein
VLRPWTAPLGLFVWFVWFVVNFEDACGAQGVAGVRPRLTLRGVHFARRWA